MTTQSAEISPETRAKALGNVLRVYRQRMDVSQERLGLNAGMGNCAVQQYEQGRRSPTFQALGRLLSVLGRSWSEFGQDLDAELARLELLQLQRFAVTPKHPVTAR